MGVPYFQCLLYGGWNRYNLSYTCLQVSFSTTMWVQRGEEVQHTQLQTFLPLALEKHKQLLPGPVTYPV